MPTSSNKHKSCSYFKKGEHFLTKYNTTEAIKCFDKSLQLDSENANALNGKGLYYSTQENYIAAIELFNKGNI